MSGNLESHKRVAKNTIYLTIMEGVEIAIPFLALPYIIKTVTADNYGKIAFAQSIVAYFGVVVDFGLSIVAAKEVASHRDDRTELGRIFSTMLIIKFTLLSVCLLSLNLLVCAWSKTRADILLYNYCFGVCLADVVFMKWLYQGIEKMFVITLIRSSSLLIYLGLLFTFVKGVDDYRRIPLMQSGCMVFTSLVGLFLMVKHEKIRPVMPEFAYIRAFFKKSVSFFFSRASLTVNSKIATTVIGATLGDHEVAAYDLAQKIARAALLPASMVGQAAYPFNARQKDARFATKVFFGLLLLVGVMLAALFFMAPFCVRILSHGKLPESAYLVRMLIPYIFIGSMSVYLGAPMLVAWGHSKPFNHSVFWATAILVLTYGIFYMLKTGTPGYYCLVLCLGELGVASYRLYHCIKYKIIQIHDPDKLNS